MRGEGWNVLIFVLSYCCVLLCRYLLLFLLCYRCVPDFAD